MFGATAAIESQNIVGYASSKLRSGVTLSTAQFESVSGGEYKLEDFTPTGADVIDNVYIDTFDEFGAPVNTYYWTDFGDGACWSEDLSSPVENVSFIAGKAFSVTASSENQGLQSSGVVPKNDVAFQLRTGVSLCGNPFPVELVLQDILPTGPDVLDNVYIDTFDEFGAPVDTYYWTDLGNGGCWSSDLESVADKVSFRAGIGLSVTGASEEQYITLPAPTTL